MREYFPSAQALIPDRHRFARILEHLGSTRSEPVPIPHDCLDGFFHAYWRRPEAYLSEQVRAGISVFAAMDPPDVEHGVKRLRGDLDSGESLCRHGQLMELDELDLGYRLVAN